MAEVSATVENASRFRKITQENINWLEKQTEIISSSVSIPTAFILPGDSVSGAQLSIARTVVRRAERHLSKLIHDGEVENILTLHYLNRLSSLLFVLELFENIASGKTSPTLAKE